MCGRLSLSDIFPFDYWPQLPHQAPLTRPREAGTGNLLFHNSWHWVSWKGTYLFILSDSAQFYVIRQPCHLTLGQPHLKEPGAVPSITQSATKQSVPKPLGEKKRKFNTEREESILTLSFLPEITIIKRFRLWPAQVNPAGVSISLQNIQ